MKVRDIIDLILLSALWGASFLFMRIAAPEFGPVVLAELRIAIAALVLLPILILRANVGDLKANWGKLLTIGSLNTAIPFMLFPFSTLYLTGGFTAILNATAPLFTAIIAWLWLSAALSASRIVGLIIGFGGVVVLVWNKGGLDTSVILAIVAGIVASLFYGIGANYTKRYMQGIGSLVIATGSQIAAALVLLPGAIALWPDGPISLRAWMAVIAMGIFCTGIAYILYFRLIANVGPASAITVTYLVPGFAVLWGAIFIDESLTTNMVIGCTVILLGTALATGLLSFGKRSETEHIQRDN
jgi:drug/metabolite transporter (DMT)-like permease